MAYRFTADVACGLDDEDEDDCVLAGVAESGGGFSLTFMCDFAEPDEQEISLGMDTHCLVTADQGTAYGCVREATIEGELLRIALDPDSLDDLNLDEPVVEALLRAPAADIARFREVLPRILAFGRPEARPATVGL